MRKWLKARLKETIVWQPRCRPRLACHDNWNPLHDPIEREAWHIAGQALARDVPFARVGPSAAVEFALQRGWLLLDGNMLKPPRK